MTPAPESADALTVILAAPVNARRHVPIVEIAGLPPQAEVDRSLEIYEAWVEVDTAVEVS